MKRNVIALGLGMALLSGAAQADTVLGVYAGASQWSSGLSGKIGITDTDFSTLGFDDEKNNVLYVALEHPVPLVPNIMLKQTDLSTTGNATLAGDVQFDDINFTSGEALMTDFDLTQTDATFYYEILDNWLNLDLGLTLRQYKGDLTAMSMSESETIDLDTLLPMGYVKGQIDLPLTGFSLKADANVISYSGDSITDFSAAVAWKASFLVAFDVGVEAGYRRLNLDLDDLGDLETNLTIDGPYVGFTAHF
ncbi:TIGR04219 family outer membrane beta-barrel protein [Porticoccaceae bacterium LTM1]|nr:TIGR04219 family outer membrane beta-barrel protein [Porticoccaceae bacterium LTM1]